MKISTRSRYSLRIMAYLADRGTEERPISLREISRKRGISLRYVEQLVIPLKNAGLLRSAAGKFGGYRLAKKPRTIRAIDIIEASSGPIRLLDCVRNRDSCDYYRDCITRKMWEAVNATLVRVLSDFTLDDLSISKMKLKRRSKIDKWLRMKC